MTVRYMLDTNVLSALVRDPYGPVAERLERVGLEATCCSIVVAAELRYGIVRNRSMRQLSVVEGVLSRMNVLALDKPADDRYAELRADLERRGEVIGPNDLFIAAHALSLDLTLVSDNVGEFERVRELCVENWTVRSAGA